MNQWSNGVQRRVLVQGSKALHKQVTEQITFAGALSSTHSSSQVSIWKTICCLSSGIWRCWGSLFKAAVSNVVTPSHRKQKMSKPGGTPENTQNFREIWFPKCFEAILYTDARAMSERWRTTTMRLAANQPGTTHCICISYRAKPLLHAFCDALHYSENKFTPSDDCNMMLRERATIREKRDAPIVEHHSHVESPMPNGGSWKDYHRASSMRRRVREDKPNCILGCNR